MFIAYILFGIATGLVAAIVSFLMGAGFLVAVGAYIACGMICALAAVLPLPKRTAQPKQPIAQSNSTH